MYKSKRKLLKTSKLFSFMLYSFPFESLTAPFIFFPNVTLMTQLDNFEDKLKIKSDSSALFSFGCDFRKCRDFKEIDNKSVILRRNRHFIDDNLRGKEGAIF